MQRLRVHRMEIGLSLECEKDFLVRAFVSDDSRKDLKNLKFLRIQSGEVKQLIDDGNTSNSNAQ